MDARKKILVVDDERDFTSMIKLNLEARGGYDVRAENKGANAVAAAKKFKPDLIFLDIIMPDLDGGAVLFQLKSDIMTRDIPVVFLTAIMTESEVVSSDSIVSGYPFLAKPVSVKKLIECIKKYTGNIKG